MRINNKITCVSNFDKQIKGIVLASQICVYKAESSSAKLSELGSSIVDDLESLTVDGSKDDEETSLLLIMLRLHQVSCCHVGLAWKIHIILLLHW